MLRVLYFLMMVSLLSSCLNYKNQIYFKSNEFSTSTPTLNQNQPFEYRLQANDVLSVKVQSLDPQIANFFNIDQNTQRFGNDPASLYLTGYSLDENGSITLPTLGKLIVKDLTVLETQELIQQKIDTYLKNSIVLVKLISFKVSVLGEVNKPGYYFIYNNQATLPEALALSGDLTEFGNRENVKLIRQTDQGSEVILLDLTDPKILTSKYYYLLPNDVLYIEPKRALSARSNLAPINVFFGALSTVIAILVTLNLVK